MKHSASLGELAKALTTAQAELTPAPMNATNPFLKSKYADLGAVIATAKPVLAKHGLSYSQHPYGEGGKIGVETILMHSSGEWLSSGIELDAVEERGKSAAQVAGSIITYLRRYALAAALGIYADEDTDGHAPRAKPAAPRTAEGATLRSEAQSKKLWALIGEVGMTSDEAKAWLSGHLGFDVESTKGLTTADASKAIEGLQALATTGETA